MEKTFNIEGMSCHHCIIAVETELREVDLTNHEVRIGAATVEYNSQEDEPKIIKAIEEAGFKVIN